MRGVYGWSLLLASGLATVACAETTTVNLQSNYDESKSVAASTNSQVSSQANVPVVAATPAAQSQLAAVTKPAPAKAQMSNAEAKLLVERYFSSINTLRAQFTQSTTGEPFSQEGVFYLKKPRQFLWRYETPTRQKIVGTGAAVYYQDEETNQVTQLPNNSGVTKMFTEGRLDLNREGISVQKAVDGPIETTVWLGLSGKAGSLGGGEIKNMKLVFGKNPVELRTIEATDVTGAVTTIRLNDVVRNSAVDSKLFKFTPPHYQNR